MGYQVITRRGYEFPEVSSAMQKSIRRADEDGALYWATELDMSGFGEYVWKRLRIIASEDVGIAAAVSGTVFALYQNWIDQRKKKDKNHAPERLFLVHAVILLCRSKKSRIVDHALITYYHGNLPKRPIPDYALDKHTPKGRARGRSWDHFWTEGTKLVNSELPDPYLDSAKEATTGIAPTTLFVEDTDENPEEGGGS